jgi:cysteine-S-conjugate beta-lyase
MKPDTKLSQISRTIAHNPKTVSAPLHRASTVLFDSLAELHSVQQRFDDGEQVPTYGIMNMPQALALENAVAEIEHGYRAMSYSSGLAAVACALLACVKAGDHVLIPDSVYTPCRDFCDTFLRRMNVETTYYAPDIGADIQSLLRPNTTVIYTELPGSHTFEMQDLPAIAAVARAHGAKVILDNAWATGLFFDGFKHGADLVVQPATKYYAGHSDVLIGLVVANEATWPQLKQTSYCLGQRASPDDCFLALRGMRTMGVRLRRHQESALKIATWLETQPEVARVLYPALPSDAGYALWKRDFSGAAGLFSVELKPCSDATFAAMIDGYEYFGLGYSWGGFESLVVPAYMQRSVQPWRGGKLMRLQIGLEDADDLIDDLRNGFARLRA